MDKREIRKQFFLAVFNRDKKCRTCGVGWKDDYIPGGPYVVSPCEAHEFHRTDMSLEEFNAQAALSKEQHAEWMHGFYEGRGYRDKLRGTSNGN